MKKNILLCILMCVLCIGCGSVREQSSSSGKSKPTSESDESKIPFGIEKADMRDNGSQIVIDDYTITLLKEYYDATNYSGCCIFEVQKKNGQEKVEYTVNDIGPYKCSFGDNSRYVLHTGEINGGSVKDNITYEEKENSLYLYFDFSLHTRNFDGTIHIMDTTTNPTLEYENSENIFTLTNTSESGEYISSDGRERVLLTEMSFQIVSDKGVNSDTLSIGIHYTDGSSEEMISNGEIVNKIISEYSNAEFNGDNNVYVKYDFESLMDISKVKSITYNGNVLEKK